MEPGNLKLSGIGSEHRGGASCLVTNQLALRAPCFFLKKGYRGLPSLYCD